MVLNKEAYVGDDTWSKVVKVVFPAIIKIKVMNFSSV